MTDRRSVTSALCQKQTLRQTAISRDELVHSTDDSYGQWFRTSAHGDLAQRKATHFDPSSCGDDFGHDELTAVIFSQFLETCSYMH